MNDTQLLDQLGRANAYADDASLPEAVWTHDLALREIDRRIGMQTQEKKTPGEAASNGRVRFQSVGRYLVLDMTRQGADPAAVDRAVNPPDPATTPSPPWHVEGGALGYQHGMIAVITVIDR